ncbi:MAG: HAD family hydrolase [Candidatus Aenigmarchaeota archaeon]|nr:HAD family hydrolase [Candidatus Aenigmarchaeota archaeon]
MVDLSGKEGLEIVFDFDHTLFSTKKWVRALIRKFKDLGVPEEVFSRTFYACKDGPGYRSEAQIGLIKKELPEVDEDLLREVVTTHTRLAKECLYPDVLPFLKRAKGKVRMHILTLNGEDVWGRIRGCEIEGFFEKIMVVQNPNKLPVLEKMVNPLGRAVFVEDNPKALEDAKKALPGLTTIRIDRGEGGYSGKPSGEGIDVDIKSFDELEI